MQLEVNYLDGLATNLECRCSPHFRHFHEVCSDMGCLAFLAVAAEYFVAGVVAVFVKFVGDRTVVDWVMDGASEFPGYTRSIHQMREDSAC